MTPSLSGLRLLDAGCGTGRRLGDTGAAEAMGIDLCREMLEAGLGVGAVAPGVETRVADICALPFPDMRFDIAWCRLAIGHIVDCVAAYAELARVIVRGGWVIVSDFHPDAHAAGHRRTFRAGGAVHELVHHVHRREVHLAAASAAGLAQVDERQARVGPAVRDHYQRAGKLAQYGEQLGLPLVLALSFRRVC
jgi:malonyl-CoA O-methyltransferase